MSRKVSCVICAYNEAGRIGDVLKVVVGHPRIAEVIVVNDGSRDGTADVVRLFPNVKLIVNEKNMGKSASLVRGVTSASGDLVLTLDADLKNLTEENVTALVEPVLSEKANISMSMRGNSLLLYRAIGIDFVSGERVIPRSLIAEHAEEIRHLPHFGVESFMNKYIIAGRMKIAIVRLDNVINSRKREKVGWWRGLVKEWGMILDILRVISPAEVLHQNYAMLKLARFAGTRDFSNTAAERSHE
jgi:glycosyltransferase involved in cell wall biosynthesis